MDKVIDFHTHPYGGAAEFMCFYGECFSPSPEQCGGDLERAGIGRFCGSVLLKEPYDPAEGFGYLRRCNRRAMELKELWGDRYVPGFHIHPDFVGESLEEMAEMHRRGVRLIGELTPYLHGWQGYAHRGLTRLLDAAGEYGMAVSFHTPAGEGEDIARMAAEHPDVTFVAAHPGDRESFLAHLERMERCGNLYLDLSGTGIFRYGLVAYGVRRLGSERFLFGSDYPICNPRMYVQAIYQEPISQTDRENILHKNAARILGLQTERNGEEEEKWI